MTTLSVDDLDRVINELEFELPCERPDPWCLSDHETPATFLALAQCGCSALQCSPCAFAMIAWCHRWSDHIVAMRCLDCGFLGLVRPRDWLTVMPL